MRFVYIRRRRDENAFRSLVQNDDLSNFGSCDDLDIINSMIKTYRLDGYFLSHYLKDIQYIGSNMESAHLSLLLYEFIRYNQSKIHPCITVSSF